MAWDPAHEVTLLFGGDTERGPTNDLEAWDGAAWTLLASDGPPARNDAILVADPARGVVVLFGGRTSGHVFTDTWEWDGSAWHELDVQGPPARVHAAAAWPLRGSGPAAAAVAAGSQASPVHVRAVSSPWTAPPSTKSGWPGPETNDCSGLNGGGPSPIRSQPLPDQPQTSDG
jgi:hypothetical protein